MKVVLPAPFTVLLQTGALATTFTASQGSAADDPQHEQDRRRAHAHGLSCFGAHLATHALSIFGDHSDVMSCRTTGFGMLCSNSVQEAMDMALIAHAAALESRIPFLHFFDGFRTSHEVNKIEMLKRRRHAGTDQHGPRSGASATGLVTGPSGVARNGPEPGCVLSGARSGQPVSTLPARAKSKRSMDKFAEVVGRSYHLFDYVGAPDAEHVLVMMGSGAEAAHETVDALLAAGQKVGLLKVRLYRPFSVEHFPSSASHHRANNRGFGSHEGSWRNGRPPLSRCGECVPGRAEGEGRSFRCADYKSGRPIWALVQGIHARHGESGV